MACDVAPDEGDTITIRFHGGAKRDDLVSLAKDAKTIVSPTNEERASLIPLDRFSWQAVGEVLGWIPPEDD